MSDRRVFLLQMPPKHVDIRSAADYGKLIGPLLDREPLLDLSFGVDETLRQLREGLSTYTSDDLLLLLGNPVTMGLATVVAADSSLDGYVQFLKWEARRHKYIEVLVDLNE